MDNNSVIACGVTDMVYKRIEPQLSNYMGRVFEEICMQYLWKQLLEDNTPVEFVSLGRWWGNDAIQKAQAERDIMEILIGRSRLFCCTKVHSYLFSKFGFTKGCMEKAKEMGYVTLVSYADIIGTMKNSI